MGTSLKPVSTVALFLALAAMPQTALAFPRLTPLLAQSATVEPIFEVPDSVPNNTTVKIGSSSSLAGINEVLAQRFENQFSGAQVDVEYTNSDEAIAALAAGTVDIAAIGRPLTDAEKAQGYTTALVGRHKIAIVVSEDNPFAGEITTVQFSQLFRGEIDNWSELEGGTVRPLRFVDRPNTSDTRQALSFYPVFTDSPFETGANATAIQQDSTEALVQELGTDGIGFAIAGQAVDRPDVRVLAMHKVLPTNPAYPFSQPLSYVYKGEASPAVQAFLGYATSSPAVDVLDEAQALGSDAAFGGIQGKPNLDRAALAQLVGLPSNASSGADASSSSDSSDSETSEDGTTTETPASTVDSDAAADTGASDTAASDADGSTADSSDAASDATGSDTATADTGDSATDAAVGADADTAPTTTGDGVETDGADSTTDSATDSATDSDNAGQLPWWLIWALGFPIFLGLLWFLLRNKDSRDKGKEVSPIAGIDPDRFEDKTPKAGATQSVNTKIQGDIPPKAGIGKAVAGAAAGTAVAGAAVAAAGSALTAESGAKAGSASGAVTALPTEKSQMVMVPRDSQSAYAYWEVSDAEHARLRQDGGQDFMLRLYDVTDRDPEAELPKPLQQLGCEPEDSDCHLVIPATDRDYVAEVGYLTDNETWLSATRSAMVHVASDLPSFPGTVPSAAPSIASPSEESPMWGDVSEESLDDESPSASKTSILSMPLSGAESGTMGATVDKAADTVTDAGTRITDAVTDTTNAVTDTVSMAGNGLKGAAIAGGAAVTAGVAAAAKKAVPSKPSLPSVPKPNRLILVPRVGNAAYAYWEITEEKKAKRRAEGGEKMALRLYDVTGIDPRTQKPHGVQQFDCQEGENDLHVIVPTANRIYLADLGYLTSTGKWLRLAYAYPVQVPAKSSEATDTPITDDLSSEISAEISRLEADLPEMPNLPETLAPGSGLTESLPETNEDEPSGTALNIGGNIGGNIGSNISSNISSKFGGVVGSAVGVAGGIKTTVGDAIASNPLPNLALGTSSESPSEASLDESNEAVRPATQTPKVILVGRGIDAAYAYWEIPDQLEAELRQQDIDTLSLRVHDVTNIDLAYSPPHSTQEFECALADRDRHVPIPTPDKDYLAELGYITGGIWVQLARSLHIHVD